MTDSFRVNVVDSIELTPNLRRVTLAGDSLSAWESTGQPDEFVHIHIPDADSAEGWEDDHDIARHYTIRRWDKAAQTIVVDIVTHGHGRGSTWARTCQPGDVVAISAPHGYYGAPEHSTKRLLLADATGLPAVARILEEASPEETFQVIVELLDEADKIALPSPADVDVQWLIAGNGRALSELVPTMATLDELSDDTYIWVACETKASREARKHVRTYWMRHHTLYRIVGYWHFEQEERLKRWLALTPEQQARYAEIWDESRPDEVNWIELEPFLQEVGL
ncbi:siderophore-interacting protein [Demequina globuliformis]|uniref:siderophore-interacting protein n=1 Tax=Demequina globuliformis TaxID=676202 RepID=UPI00078299D2|nr:siderophore-interacting protein [Demequina globuliformis]